MKKLLAILCAAMLLVACCIPVLAASDGVINISGGEPGTVYSAYQIATLEYNGGAYSYKLLPAWEEFVSTGAGKDYLAVNSNGYLEEKGSLTAEQKEALAKAALAYAAESVAIKATVKTATAGADGKAAITGLDYGYFVVDSSLGSLCHLDSTDKEATIVEKNKKPGIEKTVNGKGEETVKIGDTVTYTITITAQKGAVNYKLHDKMSAGLTYNHDVVVTFKGATLTTADYTLTEGCGDGCTFEIEFKDPFCDTLENGDEIIVTYSATLNESAKVEDGTPDLDNPNSAKLDYGDGATVETTPESIVDVKTYQFEFVKTADKNGETYPVLDGATFKLYDAATGGNVIKPVETAPGEYRIPVAGEGTVEEITTKNGKAVVWGLDSGIYYLEETAAPAGYNVLKNRAEVDISTKSASLVGAWDGTVYTHNDADIHVINKTGVELPETGGFGTTMFILIGGGLMLCTGILLVTKKRMEKIAD